MSQITVELPDGSRQQLESGATVEDLAYSIGTGLGDDCLGAYVDGELVGKEQPLSDGVTVRIVTTDSDTAQRVRRHSAAHVLAQALKERYDNVQLAIGPPTDDGFYYDVSGVDIGENDLDAIEEDMEDIIETDYPIRQVNVPREEAFEHYTDNPYKQQILEEEAAGSDPVSFYEQDSFRDLCNGPHVPSTGEIGAVSLLSVSSAYWRGDESNDSLVRIHGTAFASEEDLEEYLEQRERAKKRDHRRLGEQLGLFTVPDHSPAAHFHPNGMIVRRQLEEFIREKNDKLGYREVDTPELNRAALWKRSGHYDAFAEDGEMFAWEQDETEYGLKPMNCANHAYLYEQEVTSYRDLPMRFSEFGTVYRNERSGATSGLFRVRGFTQDDGHAFVPRSMIEEDVRDVLETIEDVYETFGLERSYKLETKPDNAIGDDELWEEATDALRNALESLGIEYDVEEGEGAFYGPKIGADVQDALGREWTMGTVQLDFNIPERFELTYTDENNEEARPVLIHRALLGAFERFLAVLVEHTNGHLPPWLSPTQVRIIPISEDNHEYAQEIADRLSDYRVEVDDSDNTLDRRIRAGHDDRIPYMLIVGDDEQENNTVAVRDWNENEQRGITQIEFKQTLAYDVNTRSLTPSFFGEDSES